MGKVKSFSIQLDKNPTREYYCPGEIVHGRVEIVLNEPVEIRAIRLLVQGKAYCQWKTTGSRQRTKICSQEETYMDKLITLWGKEKGDNGPNPAMTEAGSYNFSLSFQIPLNCAPSCEGAPYGWIRYWCKAYIDIPRAFDPECTVPFTVVRKLYLHEVPSILTPQKQEKSKTFGRLSCASGTLECTAEIQRSGFIPGESVLITGEINNMSTVEVSRITIDLIQIITFTAEGNTKHICRKVDSVMNGYLQPGTSRMLNELFPIPQVGCTIECCTIVRLDYELQINVVTKGVRRNVQLVFPIVIGNVPLATS